VNIELGNITSKLLDFYGISFACVSKILCQIASYVEHVAHHVWGLRV